ncbi:hypothetical protein ACFE04_007173 [Oxalis oulophora]
MLAEVCLEQSHASLKEALKRFLRHGIAFLRLGSRQINPNNRAETLLYTIADAQQKNGGWFGFISDGMEVIMKDGLSAVHVPYSYGFAIILLTLIVKVATLPLTKGGDVHVLSAVYLIPKHVPDVEQGGEVLEQA